MRMPNVRAELDELKGRKINELTGKTKEEREANP
jgi:hypothetical protein